MYVGLGYINGIAFHLIPLAHNLLHGLAKTFYYIMFGGEKKERYDGLVNDIEFEKFHL